MQAGHAFMLGPRERFHVEDHKVDGPDFIIRQAFAVIAVGLDRRVNAHLLHCSEQARGKPVLHERLPA
jgi:hypothetical protein